MRARRFLPSARSANRNTRAHEAATLSAAWNKPSYAGVENPAAHRVVRVMSQARRVLVVEDETIVALFIEDLLVELGHEVAGVVYRLEEAMARADDRSFDFAILDVHLAGKEVFPFADALVDRGVPFLFATGYGMHGIPERLLDRPTLQKPFRPDELAETITRLAQQH